jgi:hypothetical protein
MFNLTQGPRKTYFRIINFIAIIVRRLEQVGHSSFSGPVFADHPEQQQQDRGDQDQAPQAAHRLRAAADNHEHEEES